jgi:hypothetical protein
MTRINPENLVTIDKLLNVYKNVKIDSFYETGHLTALKFATYEENIEENLGILLDKINSNNIEWFSSTKFTGSYEVVLKSVNFSNGKDNINECSGPATVYSNQNRKIDSKFVPEFDYRVIGNHSIDFHVLSGLWIELVGNELDSKIGKSSYGCRLKSISSKQSISCRTNGYFKSYINDYQRWQKNGLDKITYALKSDKKVIAVMYDIKKFYHRLHPEFLVSKKFQKEIGFTYNDFQIKITNILLTAINSWSKQVFESPQISNDFKLNGHSGIPMGIGASKIIANLSLVYLDSQIQNEVKPIYYGRYVDDIFLVLEESSSIDSTVKIWTYLTKRIAGLKKPPKQPKNKKDKKVSDCISEGYKLEIPYLTKSCIEFGYGKEKYFFLEGLSGLSLLDSIESSIEENSSEWKLPPNPAHDIESVKNDLTSLNNDPNEIITGIGKSNGLSIQRNKFVLYLKRFETVIDLVPIEKWNDKIENFIKLTTQYAITPKTICIFAKYYPKIIGLAIKTQKYKLAISLITQIEDCYTELNNQLNNHFKNQLKNQKNKLKYDFDKVMLSSSLDYQKELLFEGIYSNISIINNKNRDQLNLLLQKIKILRYDNLNAFNVSKFAIKLFLSDLHTIPLKDVFLQSSDKTYKNLFRTRGYKVSDQLAKEFIINYGILWQKKFEVEYNFSKIPLGLLFYSRPFSLLELTLILPNWHEQEFIFTFNKLCKFFNINSFDIPVTNNENSSLKAISIESNNQNLNRTFAFTSLETKNESWTANVREDLHDPDLTREERILDLVANILECKRCKIDYVLFPELSIPQKLLIYISGLLAKKGISLIAGIEYKHKKAPKDFINLGFNGFVSNQLAYVLCVKGEFKNQQISIIQEKTIPANKEESELFDIGGKILKADDQTKYLIDHGGFWFSGLICNDLLNIDNRAQLRGLIDALIVVEWNQDINTYDALVESTSNDLHTFVLQVNNRKYGDTRLRGPYKEAHERDKVKVRGGELDYFVVATLEVDKLREFQRNHRSPEKPFKPMPTGFKMSELRRKINLKKK